MRACRIPVVDGAQTLPSVLQELWLLLTVMPVQDPIGFTIIATVRFHFSFIKESSSTYVSFFEFFVVMYFG